MRSLLVNVALISVLAAPSAHAQVTINDTAAVVAIVEQFHAALKSGDSSFVMRMISEDAVMMEGGGVETRAIYVADHLPADIEFEQAVPVKRSPIRAAVLGDAAWATCTYDMVGTFKGKPVNSIGTELMVLSKVPDGWRVRAISWTSRARPATPAPAATPAP
jgi:ketosteroid isomerase-like protein